MTITSIHPFHCPPPGSKWHALLQRSYSNDIITPAQPPSYHSDAFLCWSTSKHLSSPLGRASNCSVVQFSLESDCCILMFCYFQGSPDSWGGLRKAISACNFLRGSCETVPPRCGLRRFSVKFGAVDFFFFSCSSALQILQHESAPPPPPPHTSCRSNPTLQRGEADTVRVLYQVKNADKHRAFLGLAWRHFTDRKACFHLHFPVWEHLWPHVTDLTF